MSLERILVVDYLLWQGYLPSDLDFPLTRYNAVGFSRN
jgi:hypothetical protein